MIFEDAINVYFCTSLKVSCRRAQHPVHCDACARYATARSEYEPRRTLSWYNILYITLTYYIMIQHTIRYHDVPYHNLPLLTGSYFLQAPHPYLTSSLNRRSTKVLRVTFSNYANPLQRIDVIFAFWICTEFLYFFLYLHYARSSHQVMIGRS